MKGLLRWTGLVLVLALAGSPVLRASEEVPEYSMKAMLLYRLSQFIYWPDGHDPGVRPVLCVAGNHPFTSTLEHLAGQAGLDLRVNPRELAVCNLLFLTRDQSGQLSGWLKRLNGLPLVSVSDIPGFVSRGGMVELPLNNGRVGILVNREVALHSGIDFNAQLLRLASRIFD